jgi:hypothetical protein
MLALQLPKLLESVISTDGLWLAAGYTALVLFYYGAVWWLVGRDRRGHIVSQYEPPEALSPPALRYLRRTAFDNKTLVSAVLDVAAHGCATISAEYGRFVLTRTDKKLDRLPREEQAFAGRLLKDEFIDFSEDNGEHIRECAETLKIAITSEVDRRFLKTNGEYVILGAAITAFVAIDLVRSTPGGMQLLHMVVIMAVGALIAMGANALDLGAVEDDDKKRSRTSPVSVITALAVVMLSGVSWISVQRASWVLVAIAVMIGINLLFQWLLKAPTQAGRKLRDEVEGFRDFLSTVELEKFRTLYPRENVPETIDRFFPYAYALDLEHEWNERFGTAVRDAIRVSRDDREAGGLDLADAISVVASLVLGAGASSVPRASRW